MNAISLPETQLGWDLKLKMEPAVTLSQEQFFDFCQQNRDMRFERTAQGEIVIMPPSGGESSAQNVSVSAQLFQWAQQKGGGMVFDSSGGFVLPNDANRSPDAAWITQEQRESLSREQLRKFVPLCPAFVVEVMSPSDRLKTMRDKMQEYADNGVKLGWLINPFQFQVHIYRPGQPVEVHDKPATLSGEPELPGFVFDFADVWNP